MSESKCCICQKSVTEVGVLYRVNAKGVPGIYACKQHLAQTDAPKPDEEVEELANIIIGQP